MHVSSCPFFPPQKITFHDRIVESSSRDKRNPLPLPEKSRFTIKGEATLVEKMKIQTFFFLPRSFLVTWKLELFRDYNNIPGNHVSRRRSRREEQRWSTEGRKGEQSGTMRCNASLMTVRKFQRIWIIHGGKQKGVEVVSDRAVLHRLNRNRSCTSACV